MQQHQLQDVTIFRADAELQYDGVYLYARNTGATQPTKCGVLCLLQVLLMLVSSCDKSCSSQQTAYYAAGSWLQVVNKSQGTCWLQVANTLHMAAAGCQARTAPAAVAA
jgi:hypothetical protein